MERYPDTGSVRNRVGGELGLGPWHEITQDSIDAFAQLTNDFNWIHVDRERARQSPFGTTIAHGFLVLSLIPGIKGYQLDLPLRHQLNYGLDRVRWITPVRAGSMVRVRTALDELRERSATEIDLHLQHTIELRDEQRPAVIASQILRLYLDEGVTS